MWCLMHSSCQRSTIHTSAVTIVRITTTEADVYWPHYENLRRPLCSCPCDFRAGSDTCREHRGRTDRAGECCHETTSGRDDRAHAGQRVGPGLPLPCNCGLTGNGVDRPAATETT